MQKIGLKKTEECSCCFYFAVSVFINLNQAQSVKQSNNHKGDCFLHHSHNPLFCFFSVLFFFLFFLKETSILSSKQKKCGRTGLRDKERRRGGVLVENCCMIFFVMLFNQSLRALYNIVCLV